MPRSPAPRRDSLPQLMAFTVDIEAARRALRGERRVVASEAPGAARAWAWATSRSAEATPTPLRRRGPAPEAGKRDGARVRPDAVFVFDEPTIGLHPLDVADTCIGVFQSLIEHGATVVVIEHDLDMIANADYVVDLGPGGGEAGGRIVATGTPEEVAANPASITGRYLSLP